MGVNLTHLPILPKIDMNGAPNHGPIIFAFNIFDIRMRL